MGLILLLFFLTFTNMIFFCKIVSSKQKWVLKIYETQHKDRCIFFDRTKYSWSIKKIIGKQLNLKLEKELITNRHIGGRGGSGRMVPLVWVLHFI